MTCPLEWDWDDDLIVPQTVAGSSKLMAALAAESQWNAERDFPSAPLVTLADVLDAEAKLTGARWYLCYAQRERDRSFVHAAWRAYVAIGNEVTQAYKAYQEGRCCGHSVR